MWNEISKKRGNASNPAVPDWKTYLAKPCINSAGQVGGADSPVSLFSRNVNSKPKPLGPSVPVNLEGMKKEKSQRASCKENRLQRQHYRKKQRVLKEKISSEIPCFGLHQLKWHNIVRLTDVIQFQR